MRLIDADALKQAIEDKQCADCPDNALGVRCAACQWDDAIGLIDDAPEIKIQTVTYRGTSWWQDKTDIDDVYIVLRCAGCGKESPTEQAFPFCPYCGRKMVGVTKLRKKEEVKADG